jgi:hypothetical protein
VHATAEPTAFVRDLFAQEGAGAGPFGHISDLEVQRPSLESTYLTMVANQDQSAEEPVAREQESIR